MGDPSRVRLTGPLTPFAQGFAAELARQGYTSISAADQLRLLAHLSRWLAARGLDTWALQPEVLDAFLATRRSEGYVLWLSRKALGPLVEYLRGREVMPPVPPAQVSPTDALLARYRDYLLSERGLVASTAYGYVHFVRPFLAARERDGGIDVAGLTPADVTRFVVATCPRQAHGSAKLTVTALRSLLRFLQADGLLDASLASAVPSVASWRLAPLPRHLEAGEVARLLVSCDRHTVTGRRDYAVLMLLARLGLRSGEVCGLRLDDIDWRAGELVVCGKGRRAERLPLPADVGQAVATYLRRGRPPTAEGRTVFVRVRAPHRRLNSVSYIVEIAARRAGLGKLHAHALRHTLATRMVRDGVPIAEVGQVLRHRRLLTTAIYAKVDREGLRLLAGPWPGGAA